MSEPEFFSTAWAAAVGDALTAGPSEQDRAGKLQMYWDFFDKIKAGHGFFAHQIGARLNFEWQYAVIRLDLICELFDPVRVESKNVVSKPDMLHPVNFFELANFSRDLLGRTELILVSRNRLGAPVAPIGASAAGDNIGGEVAMS